MITIFSIPKPFQNHIAIIQRNALQSWIKLKPACEIILVGDDHGVSDVAAEFGLRHIPDIQKNQQGTPLVNSIFSTAEQVASSQVLCYINADIILLSDFLSAVELALKWQSKILLVGRRWDLDVTEPIEFDKTWEDQLRVLLKQRGKLHAHTGIDYLVFPKGLWDTIPAFAIGRPAWDNWMLYNAISRGIHVVDGTRMITAIHQNHDYAHHPQGEQGVWHGKEAQRNLALAGGIPYAYTLLDVPYVLKGKEVRRRISTYFVYRWLVTGAQGSILLKWILKAIRHIRLAIKVGH